MSRVAVKALGSFEVLHAGQSVTSFPRRKTTALFVYLCLEQPGKMHQRDALAALLWPDTFQEDARRNLRQCLYQLRQALQDHSEEAQAHLQVTAQLVGLKSADLDFDVTTFRQLVATGDPASLDAALALYRGEILAGYSLADASPFEEWLFFQREEFQRVLKKALLIKQHLAEEDQDWPAAIAALRQLLALDPLDEEIHRALMRALFANGERRAALDQYNSCRTVLLAELSLEPQTETTELFQKIKTSTAVPASETPRPAPVLKPVVETLSAPNNLPVSLTSFVGRELDIETICGIVRRPEVHLLTLTGPGGIGKTRLSLEVAAQLEKDFADGIYFVPLASTTDPELVAASIAQTLGIKEQNGQPVGQTLKQTLYARQILLVLDNFEQIIEAAGTLEELLKAAPRLKMLVTSRFILKIYGENEFSVRSLALPDNFRLPALEVLATYPAIRLFVERARALRPEFALTAENSAALVEICARLDGLPLALELVAARVKLFAPQALVSRLRNRLSLATGGARTLPQRQQTLRGAIGWSYDLLDPTEKALFVRMAVFVGNASLPAILAVCTGMEVEEDVVIETLVGLVDKSLVRTSNGVNDEPRFGMLETIREFALENLEAGGQPKEVFLAHACYYTEYAESALSHLHGPDQLEWADLLEHDHDNFRSALQWCLDHREIDLAGRLVSALREVWNVHNHLSEALRWFERTLEQVGEENLALRANLLAGVGYYIRLIGVGSQATAYTEAAIELYRQLGDKASMAENLRGLGMIAHNTSQYKVGNIYLEEALHLFEQLGDRRGETMSLINLGRGALDQGRYEQAQSFLEKGIEAGHRYYKVGKLYGEISLAWVYLAQGDYEVVEQLTARSLPGVQALPNDNLIAFCLLNQAGAALGQARPEEALRLAGESYVLWDRTDDETGRALALLRIAYAFLALDRLDDAETNFRASLRLWYTQETMLNVAGCLEGLAGGAISRENFARGGWLLGAANHIREEYGTPLHPNQQPGIDKIINLAQPDPDFQAEWLKGKMLPVGEVVALALAEAKNNGSFP